ncbi:MAG: methyltransferase domain-containing protein [Pseudomonadota bacterium]
MAESDGPSWDLYRSPGGGQPLERVGDTLRAPETGRVFPIEGGVPNFLKFPSAETPAEAASLADMNRRAEVDGWQAALAESTKNDPSLYTYATDPKRLAQLNVLPLSAAASVLEVGPGLGQFTAELAGRVRTVHALEVVPGQAAFVVKRTRQLGLKNVTVACGGDDCLLPYAPNSFDLAVFNLVFEWCASRLSDDDAIVGQRQLLSEFARVLKPGGVLYLATKNRFGIQYLLGQPDEHVFNMRFASPLPRWLTDLRLSAAKLARPPGLLHSYNGLRDMLSAAGLHPLRSFWAAPEMRFPTRMVPTDANSVREARRDGVEQGHTRRARMIMPFVPAALVKHITPGLAFLVEKPNA